MPSTKRTRFCFVLSLCLTVLLFVSCFRRFNTGYVSVPAMHPDITNTTLGFEHIFAINAPWQTDRKDYLTLTAAESGISLDWIAGINASNLDDRAYPQGNHRQLPLECRGGWRAHMDAMRTIIERNLTTALILEDNVDWDQRIRTQLTSLGIASTLLPAMIQASDKVEHIAIPSHESLHQDHVPEESELAKHFSIPLPPLPSSPCSPPYGTDWDILWLGHCSSSPPPYPTSPLYPADRLVLSATTITHSLPSYPTASLLPRIYHRAHQTRCTHAYAVTQRGARKVLYEHGIRNFDRGFDVAIGEWCDGTTKNMGERPVCLTRTPSLFGRFVGGRREEGVEGRLERSGK